MSYVRRSILAVAFAMLLVGMWFVGHPFSSPVSMLSVIATIMLATGLCLIINYIRDKHDEQVTRWILAEGCVTLLVGVVLLSSQNENTQSLATTFGLWVLFSGITHIVASLKARSCKVSDWRWMLTVGLATTLIGFLSLLNDSFDSALGLMIGIFFTMQALNTISTFYFIEHLS